MSHFQQALLAVLALASIGGMFLGLFVNAKSWRIPAAFSVGFGSLMGAASIAYKLGLGALE